MLRMREILEAEAVAADQVAEQVVEQEAEQEAEQGFSAEYSKRLAKFIRYTKQGCVKMEEAAQHLGIPESEVMVHVKQGRTFFIMSDDGVHAWIGAYEPQAK